MGRNFKFLSFLSFALLLILVFFLKDLVWGTKNSFSTEFKVVSENLEYAFYKEETLNWKLKASFFTQTSDGSFEAENIKLISPLKGITLSSKKANYIKPEEKIIFKKEVVLVTSEFGEVYTDELVYFPQKNLILSNSEVLVKKKGLEVRGKGLVYQIDSGNFEVKGRAQIKMRF